MLCSFLGGLAIGVAYYAVILYTVDTAVLQQSAPQWPIMVVGGLGGFLGSLLDSILGATLQYSGECHFVTFVCLLFFQCFELGDKNLSFRATSTTLH